MRITHRKKSLKRFRQNKNKNKNKNKTTVIRPKFFKKGQKTRKQIKGIKKYSRKIKQRGGGWLSVNEFFEKVFVKEDCTNKNATILDIINNPKDYRDYFDDYYYTGDVNNPIYTDFFFQELKDLYNGDEYKSEEEKIFSNCPDYFKERVNNLSIINPIIKDPNTLIEELRIEGVHIGFEPKPETDLEQKERKEKEEEEEKIGHEIANDIILRIQSKIKAGFFNTTNSDYNFKKTENYSMPAEFAKYNNEVDKYNKEIAIIYDENNDYKWDEFFIENILPRFEKDKEGNLQHKSGISNTLLNNYIINYLTNKSRTLTKNTINTLKVDILKKYNELYKIPPTKEEKEKEKLIKNDNLNKRYLKLFYDFLRYLF